MIKTLETCVLATLADLKERQVITLDEIVERQDWPVYGPRGSRASELQLDARRILAFITLRSLVGHGMLSFHGGDDDPYLAAQLNNNGWHRGEWRVTPAGKDMISHILSQQAPVGVTTWATASVEVALRQARVPVKAISPLVWENNYLCQAPQIDGKGGVIGPWFFANSTAANDLANWIIAHPDYLTKIDGIGKTLARQLERWALDRLNVSRARRTLDLMDPAQLSNAVFGDRFTFGTARACNGAHNA